MTRYALPLAALSALAIAAAPTSAASISAATGVNVIKPVTITKLQDLNFGTLTFSEFSGSRTIALGRAGAFSCATDIVCSGAPTAARFNVQGTNKMVVLIGVSGGSMSNGVDSIAFTADAPSSVTLTSSGIPGVDFGIGGSISVSSTLVGGTYAGTLNVTAEYQ